MNEALITANTKDRALKTSNYSGPLRVASTIFTTDARTVGNSAPRSLS
jgi:hypothetical protein